MGWSGKVVGVADGDTITVLRDKQPQKIRLYGIDCPEKRQPFGKRAKQFTSELVFGKVVEVEPITVDRYGRTVAFVRVENISVNETLISDGLAWVFPRYCIDAVCDKWLGLQAVAKSGKQGLWQDSNVIPPWEFRKNRKRDATTALIR